MKKCLITGASRGIGRSIAEELKDEYELYLVCRSDAERLSDLPGRHYAGDVGDPLFIESVFADIDSLDLLVNNAGIACYGLVQDMTPAQWEEVIRTDLSSVFYTSSLAARIMVKQHSGRIINISSQWGMYGASCEAAYSAAKGGINSFSRSLAKELAPSGVAVNVLAPGVIDTDMNAHLSEEEKKALTDQIPAGRMGSCEEAARAVKLISMMPVYMTGQIIALDGGWI